MSATMLTLYRMAAWTLLASYILMVSGSNSEEGRLIDDLLLDYTKEERPVVYPEESVQLKFGLDLQQIIDMNERDQVVTTNMWLNLQWNDCNLRWDPVREPH